MNPICSILFVLRWIGEVSTSSVGTYTSQVAHWGVMLHASTADLEPAVVSRYLRDVWSPELSSPCPPALVCLELTLNTSLSTLQLLQPPHTVLLLLLLLKVCCPRTRSWDETSHRGKLQTLIPSTLIFVFIYTFIRHFEGVMFVEKNMITKAIGNAILMKMEDSIILCRVLQSSA